MRIARIISSARAYRLLSVVLVGIVLPAAWGVEQAVADFGKRVTPTSRIVRIEGYWLAAEQESPAASETTPAPEPAAPSGGPTPIGRLNLSVNRDGTGIRPFAVVEARAYHDADGGMEIFTKACARPAVNLRGRAEVLARMTGAPVGESMVLYGQFATGSSELLISDVELPEDDDRG